MKTNGPRKHKLERFSSVQSLDRLSRRRDMVDDSADPPSVFPAGVRCEQFWHGQGCALLDVIHPAFSLPITASSTLQGVLKDGFGEAVVACDMPEQYEFSSLDTCQKRFVWAHKEVDQDSRPIIDLVVQVGDAEKFPQAPGFESLDPLFKVSKQIFFKLDSHDS